MIRLPSLITVAALLCSSTLAADELKPIAHEDPALGRPVEFQRDVYPILESNCIACHNVTVSEGDLILESIESILKGGGSGPAVVPEKPEESLIFKLASRGEEPVMPPLPNDRQAKELNPKQLGVLRQWIIEGAQAGAAARWPGNTSRARRPTGTFALGPAHAPRAPTAPRWAGRHPNGGRAPRRSGRSHS